MLSGIKNEELRAEIIWGKLPFCYDYIDSLSKLEERQLPPQSAFYNRLKACDLSDEEYKRAQRVWTIAKCQTLKDFLLLYLIVDTRLLGDILIWWRDILYSKYGLDLPHYVSLPSYAFDSFLKMSNIELDHVYDEELYNLIRHNVRGGFTSVVRQSFTANNREINSSFNPDLHQSSYILYLDFNSLYATVMTINLPSGGIRKLSDEEKDLFLGRGIENFITNKDKGYWLLVTTKVPLDEVARATAELPLCLSHEEVTFRNLSPYCKNVLEREGGQMGVKCKKLMATHRSKKEYLISLPLLQLYMDLGLELEAVHSIYEFNQSAYMNDFMKTNIEARTAATSSTEKKAFKAMSNCVFGKTLLNPLKYAEKSRVVTKPAVYLKEARNPRLKSSIRLSEDRVICTSTLPQVVINMPNYIGFAILEAAKFLYYLFDKILKRKYGDKVKLIYTDTDSFIFALEVPDLNSEFAQEPLKSYMDFSNFDEDHPLFNNERKGELGLLKSETGSTLIAEVKALKPKMYPQPPTFSYEA
ncbi:uncharacterized protein [Palaemon carinicauda]|uniref:uncharacterized protein n=1 Tax=Palaemon carinicauda TaxID=392227 RepID=UPI0035B67F8D